MAEQAQLQARSEAALAVEVDGLVKRYGQTTAVDGISFTIQEGEIFALLGPNGAGKTTTLEILEGLRRPDAGKALVAGIDVSAHPRRVRELIGVQLQQAGFFERLTVAETLQVFAAFHRRSVPLDELIDRFHLREKARSYVTNLSGGQRQRLSLALAIINDPQIVFLDEPTTGLDPQARRILWEAIEELRADGRTVLLTTHYMEEAHHLSDRVAIMDHGKILAMDEPNALIRRYAPHSRIILPGVEADEAWSGLPGVARVEAGPEGTVLHCADVRAAMSALAQQDDGTDGWSGLRIEGGTLEDVFLNLTGRALRD